MRVERAVCVWRSGAPPLGLAAACADSGAGLAPTDRTASRSHVEQLRFLRKHSGLSRVPLQAAVRKFAAHSDHGVLPFAGFMQGYRDLLHSYAKQEVIPDDTLLLAFQLFDPGQTGLLDLTELLCGFAAFCQGSLHEKVAVLVEYFEDVPQSSRSAWGVHRPQGLTFKQSQWLVQNVLELALQAPSFTDALKERGLSTRSQELAHAAVLECFHASGAKLSQRLPAKQLASWLGSRVHATRLRDWLSGP